MGRCEPCKNLKADGGRSCGLPGPLTSGPVATVARSALVMPWAIDISTRMQTIATLPAIWWVPSPKGGPCLQGWKDPLRLKHPAM